MDRAIAFRINETEGSLRALLDDITLAALNGDDPLPLVCEARELADHLTDAVLDLDGGEEAQAARRMAARLAAGLSTLENAIAAGLVAH